MVRMQSPKALSQTPYLSPKPFYRISLVVPSLLLTCLLSMSLKIPRETEGDVV